MMNAKISKKYDNVPYMTKNYVLKPIYNNKNEYINDMLSAVIRGIDHVGVILKNPLKIGSPGKLVFL